MAKMTEYKLTNYDGGWKAYPEKGLSGSIEIHEDAKWKMNLGFRKHLNGDFKQFPLEVQPLTDSSCRVVVRNVNNPEFRVSFDLSETSAQTFLKDLEDRGYLYSTMTAAAEDRKKRIAAGEWWAEISEFKIGMGYHYAGERNKNQTGTMFVNNSGIEYKSFGGSKVKIPWDVITDIEISTQATRRVTAGRVLAMGVFALAAKKGEVYTYVHVSDPNTMWSFAIKSSQAGVLETWKPILNAWNNRVQVRPPSAKPEEPERPQMSVADELGKLAQLKDAGVLTEDEFNAQKMKLLHG